MDERNYSPKTITMSIVEYRELKEEAGKAYKEGKIVYIHDYMTTEEVMTENEALKKVKEIYDKNKYKIMEEGKNKEYYRIVKILNDMGGWDFLKCLRSKTWEEVLE